MLGGYRRYDQRSCHGCKDCWASLTLFVLTEHTLVYKEGTVAAYMVCACAVYDSIALKMMLVTKVC